MPPKKVGNNANVKTIIIKTAMKNIIILAIIVLKISNVNASATTFQIVNNSSEKLYRFTDDNMLHDFDYEIPKNEAPFFPIKSSSILLGISGHIIYSGSYSKGIIEIYYNNPAIGSSSYSVQTSSGFTAQLIINSDPDPQQVTIIITGGRPTPIPPININTTGSNIISGSITWDEIEIGKPTSNELSNIFKFICKVPTKFQPTENGKQKFNGQLGTFQGEQPSGHLILDKETIVDSKHTIRFSINQITSEVPLVIFDVQANEAVAWDAPLKKPKPTLPGDYIFFVGTDILSVKNISTTNQYADFSLISGWAEKNKGFGTGTGGLAERIAERKKITVLPPNTFMATNISRMINQNLQLQNINQKATKKNINKNAIIKTNIIH